MTSSCHNRQHIGLITNLVITVSEQFHYCTLGIKLCYFKSTLLLFAQRLDLFT